MALSGRAPKHEGKGFLTPEMPAQAPRVTSLKPQRWASPRFWVLEAASACFLCVSHGLGCSSPTGLGPEGSLCLYLVPPCPRWEAAKGP